MRLKLIIPIILLILILLTTPASADETHYGRGEVYVNGYYAWIDPPSEAIYESNGEYTLKIDYCKSVPVYAYLDYDLARRANWIHIIYDWGNYRLCEYPGCAKYWSYDWWSDAYYTTKYIYVCPGNTYTVKLVIGAGGDIDGNGNPDWLVPYMYLHVKSASHPPSITFKSPSYDGQTFSSRWVYLKVKFYDSDGNLRRYVIDLYEEHYGYWYYVDSWDGYISGYSYTWSTYKELSNGHYKLEVYVRDGDWNTLTKSITFRVRVSNPPSITYTSISNGETISTGSKKIRIRFKDPDGNLDYAEIYLKKRYCYWWGCTWDTIKIWTTFLYGTYDSWTTYYTFRDPGDYRLYIKVYDTDDNTAEKTINFKVTSHPPSVQTISISSRVCTYKSFKIYTSYYDQDGDLDFATIKLQVKPYPWSWWWTDVKTWTTSLSGSWDYFSKYTKVTSPGHYRVWTRVCDKAGKCTESSKEFDVTEHHKPTITLTSSNQVTTNSGDYWYGWISYRATAYDGASISEVKLYIDGSYRNARYWSSSGSFYVSLRYGYHTIKFVVRDNWGAENEYTTTITVKKPPSISLTLKNNPKVDGTDRKGPVKIHINAKSYTDFMTKIEIYVDGHFDRTITVSSWYYHTSFYSGDYTTRLSVGWHTIKAIVYDNAGSTNSREIRVYVRDDNPPDVSVNPSSGWYQANELLNVGGNVYYWTYKMSFTVTVKDDIQWKSLSAKLDNNPPFLVKRYTGFPDYAPWQAKECSFTYTIYLHAGTNRITVEAYDYADHRTTKTFTYEVYIGDTHKPEIKYIKPTTVYTNTNTANVNFEIKVSDDHGTKWDGLTRIQVFIDGKCVVDKKGKLGKTYTVKFTRKLNIGKHQILVKARDYSAFETSKSAYIQIKKNSVPSVTIYADNKYYTTTNTAKVQFSVHASDDTQVQKLAIYIDSNLIKTTYPHSKDITVPITTNIHTGTHTIKAIAYDNLGTTQTATKTIQVIKKDIAIDIKATTDIPYMADKVPLLITVTSPVKGSVEITIDGTTKKFSIQPFKQFTFKKDLSAPANRPNAIITHTITVTVRTEDGNVKTVTKTITAKRTPAFIPNSQFTLKVKVDKGLGETSFVGIKYNGKWISPERRPSDLYKYERAIVDVPFKITSKSSDYVYVKICNPAGCDDKYLYLQVSDLQEPSAPPAPTPTPPPTPTPTPSPTPTSPACYDRVVTDVSGGGSNYDEGSGVGHAMALVSFNELHVYAREEVAGAPVWSEAWLYSDFNYDTTTHIADVTVNYDLLGILQGIGVGVSGYAKYYVKCELIDLTTNTVLDYKEHEDKLDITIAGANKKIVNQKISDKFSVRLVKGHKYRVKLYAKVETQSNGLGQTVSDFYQYSSELSDFLKVKYESTYIHWCD